MTSTPSARSRSQTSDICRLRGGRTPRAPPSFKGSGAGCATGSPLASQVVWIQTLPLGTGGGRGPDVSGFFYPRTATLRSSLLPPPPWRYSRDLLTVDFRTDPAPG